ncbi:MAG: transcriptional repressor [Campylobacterales bacterium]|nr:transcriptional repressor [Campylobacterales bacterium]
MSVEKIIEEKNLKLTTARKELLELFSKATTPLSYEDLKNSLTMDKATFYRNISKFEEEGIVDSFESNDKKRYFELKKACHGHFLCVKCNKVECINQPLNISLGDCQIDSVMVKGICKECIG